MRKAILKIKPYEPGRPIEEVKRELGLIHVIKLASNENPLGPSPKAICAIKAALASLNRYPDGGLFYLRRAVARHLAVKADRLVFGNGSDELVTLALRAFLSRGEEVLLSPPTFPIYNMQAAVCGARVRLVPMKNFRYDLNGMRRRITKKTRLVFIANPNNPTGTYVTADEVKEFLDGLSPDTLVFFDEAYYEFVNERDFPDVLRYIERGNVILTRTFSKAYGLAGLRVGYGVAHPKLAEYMNRVREPFNVNSLAQAGAVAALQDEDFLKKTQALVASEKGFLYRELIRLGFDYVKSAANFILVALGRDCRKLAQHLLERGIIVRDMSTFGLNRHIRVTIGTHSENRRLIAELESLLGGIGRR